MVNFSNPEIKVHLYWTELQYSCNQKCAVRNSVSNNILTLVKNRPCPRIGTDFKAWSPCYFSFEIELEISNVELIDGAPARG
jgi:hypothetical protein